MTGPGFSDSFPCNNCGACCFEAWRDPGHRRAGRATPEYPACKELDCSTKMCRIYETRPFQCRPGWTIGQQDEETQKKFYYSFCNYFHQYVFGEPIEPWGEPCHHVLPEVTHVALHKPKQL